ENLDDGHGHVPADVIPGGIPRHELLRRVAGIAVPVSEGLALRGHLRDHGDIALLRLDLREAAALVLTPPRGPAPSRPVPIDPIRTSSRASTTMNARWRLRPHDRDRILALSRSSGLSPLVAQLLINRGIEDPRRAVAFLEARMGNLHDPELLPGAAEAAA